MGYEGILNRWQSQRRLSQICMYTSFRLWVIPKLHMHKGNHRPQQKAIAGGLEDS